MQCCVLMMENEKESVKKKGWFAEDVKQLSEAGMMCTIWDSSALCHIINDDTTLFNITNIDMLIQGSSGIMSTEKKGKLS